VGHYGLAIAIEVVGGLVFLLSLLNLAAACNPWPRSLTVPAGPLYDQSLRGVLSGLVATTLLDSSPVTIILLIALVNGGLLTFPLTTLRFATLRPGSR
jgi:hypothetical protein